jgi:hypothetical protein
MVVARLSILLVRDVTVHTLERALTLLPANATGLGWEDAFAQASSFVSQLSLEVCAQSAKST